MAFPKTLAFGVATSDHQCESYNSALEDIRDVWDRELRLTERGRATEFQKRYGEDIELARSLGAKAFRFSISWTKLEPRPGEFSAEAMAHYRRVAECIRDAGMAPLVTLMHFTWPIHIEERGGMIAPEFPERFAKYAAYAAAALGPLASHWITINEPGGMAFGYIKPWWARNYSFPPGLPPGATIEDQMRAVSDLIRNLFLAHTRARAEIRRVNPDAKVGSNPSLLGLPSWLQKLVDRNATMLKGPEDLDRQARRYAGRTQISSGKVDVAVATFTMTQARADVVSFTDVYYVASQAVLLLAASSAQALTDLSGKPLAVIEGSTAVSAASKVASGSPVHSVKNLEAALETLERGTASAFLSDDVILMGVMARFPAKYRMLTAGVAEEPYAAAVALGNPELLDAVDYAVWSFKVSGAWQASFARHFPDLPVPKPPDIAPRETLATLSGREPLASFARAGTEPLPLARPGSLLRRIQDRGFIRIGVKQDVPGFGYRDPQTGEWSGLEVDLAHEITRFIFADANKVELKAVETHQRIPWLRGILRILDPILKPISILTTLVNTNWWHLGMAGRLPEFLCPAECRGRQDFVGLDYYWGLDNLHLYRIFDLVRAGTEGRYDLAPVTPPALYNFIKFCDELFPGAEIVIVENGCVETASGMKRADYYRRHLREVQRAVGDGFNVGMYIAWSITSNVEWGFRPLPSCDFGLYHIDLLNDPDLVREKTEAASVYSEIIRQRTADFAKT